MHYYTYAYLREDKTPYYIGKGKGSRIYSKQRSIKPPKDKSRIIFLKQNLTQTEAFRHEIYMIAVFGRKDLGTGILHNRTDGGEGLSGTIRSDETRRKISEAKKNMSDETRKKMSEANKGEKNPYFGKTGELHHNYGKTASKESNIKRSVAMSGEKHPNFGKKRPEHSQRISGEKNHNYGKKWWNDGCGNKKMMVECPGDGWRLGRK
jgi:hypothetical protein